MGIQHALFNFDGNCLFNVRLDFVMRILFDYEYDKYLGAFRFVLVSRNNGTITSLFVCTKTNYGSGLRAAASTMQMKAFRLNKYENCGGVTVLATASLDCILATTV